jgi:hypothetical protein
MLKNFVCYLSLISALASLSACTSDLGPGTILGRDQVSHQPYPIPFGVFDSPFANPPTTPAPPAEPVSLFGPSCSSGDSHHMCLSLKYVVYSDSTGAPVTTQSQTLANLAAINQIWSQCDVGFQIQEYLPADSTQYGLEFNPANTSELDTIREAFSDANTLLVVTTGTWNRSGTLGTTGANAWTNMPGDSLSGSILEEPMGNFPNIIAHELGHYLNLPHVKNTSNLMTPLISPTSTGLAMNQCSAARQAAAYYWPAMRH